MKKLTYLIPMLATLGLFTGCGDSNTNAPAPKEDHGHAHAEGGGKDDHAHEEKSHEHEEIALGTFDISGISVAAAQGHGKVEAGKEGHLVIKLPYNDQGETVVRAWIGSGDRTLSAVGKGEYAPSHDDYDIHAIAPDRLLADTKWWVEIEKPDGTKAMGSFPLLKDIKKER